MTIARLVSSIALAVLLLAAVTARPARVHACSAGPDFDPLEGLDVIVTGFATDVALIERVDGLYFVVVDVAFEVDRYLLGSGPRELSLRDGRSASLVGVARSSAELDAIKLADVMIDDLLWDGSGGACGALNSDPRGQYWVAGATRAADGTLGISIFSLFGIGTSPEDPQIVERITFVEGLLDEAGLRPARAGNLGIVDSGGVAVPGGSAIAVALTGLMLVGIRQRIQDRQ